MFKCFILCGFWAEPVDRAIDRTQSTFALSVDRAVDRCAPTCTAHKS